MILKDTTMALKDFINKFDKDNSAIPLEGKRTV